MGSLPSGTVTFVFTDIAGSTRLLKELGDTAYGELLGLHRRLVRETFAGYEGREIDTQGDAFFYSFVRARQAVAAAVDVQRAHARASWPGGTNVLLRIGLHTGEPVIGDEGYTGLDVVRAARIAAAGAAGQVLISDTTRAIAAGDLPGGVGLRSLGERQLKDLDRPELVWELTIDEVGPAPSATDAADVPAVEAPASAASALEQLVGRTRERITSRVIADLQRAWSDDEPWPDSPPAPPRRSATREIARLHALREQGALTDEQYRRAVDRLLDEGERDETR